MLLQEGDQSDPRYDIDGHAVVYSSTDGARWAWCCPGLGIASDTLDNLRAAARAKRHGEECQSILERAVAAGYARQSARRRARETPPILERAVAAGRR